MSKLNKQYIEEISAQGLIAEAGFKKIETAKQDGCYKLDAIEALIIPADLAEVLSTNATAKRYFQAFNN